MVKIWKIKKKISKKIDSIEHSFWKNTAFERKENLKVKQFLRV